MLSRFLSLSFSTTLLRCAAFLCCFALAAAGRSQTPAVVHYDLQHGLPGNTVYDISQDKDGYLWIATDRGVSRYNGYEFENFGMEHGLSHSTVLKVQTDSRGRTWFLTMNGKPSYFYNNQFYNPDNSALLSGAHLPSFCKHLVEDKDGTIWIQSHRNGYLRIHGTEEDGHTELMPEELLIHLYKNSLGDVNLILSEELFSGTSAAQTGGIPLPLTLSRTWRFADVPGTNTSWFGNIVEGGLFSINHHTAQIDTIFPAFAGRVNCISTTSDGTTWIGSETGIVDPIGGTRYLAGAEITCMFEDAGHNYWFGTRQQGMYFMHASRVLQYLENTGTAMDKVSRIGKDEQGRVWCWGGNFLECINSNEAGLDKRFTEDLLMNVQFDGSNRWLCFQNKLLNDHTSERYPTNAVVMDFNDSICYSGSTSHFATCSRSDMAKPDIKEHQFRFLSRISSLLADHQNGCYIGTPNGLLYFNGSAVVSLVDSFPGLSGTISDMIQTPTGLWVASRGNGLHLITETGEHRWLTAANGLGSNLCNALDLDSRGNLWVATDKGVTKVPAGFRLNDSIPLVNYDALYGLPGPAIRDLCVNHDTIWIATRTGVSCFTEEQIKHPHKLSISLTALSVNGIEQALRPDSVYEFSHLQNTVDLNYLAISHESHGKLRYFYRLEGLSDAWHPSDHLKVSFQRLPPGNYTFRVRPATIDPSVEARFSFVITPPVWKRSWFWMLVALALVLLSYFVFRMRILSYNKEVARDLLQLLLIRVRKQPMLHVKTVKGAYLKLPIGSVLYVQAARDYVELFTETESHLIRSTMKGFGQQLKSQSDIVRVHRSYFVNLARVNAYFRSQHRNQSYITIGSIEISVGESYKAVVTERLAKSGIS